MAIQLVPITSTIELSHSELKTKILECIKTGYAHGHLGGLFLHELESVLENHGICASEEEISNVLSTLILNEEVEWRFQRPEFNNETIDLFLTIPEPAF